MFPYLAAGAGQGVEDAYLLSQLLSHPQTTMDNVEGRYHPHHLRHPLDLFLRYDVLQAYSDVRRPRSQRIHDLGIRSGRIYQGRGSHGLEKEGLKQDVAEIDAWLENAYVHPINQDFEQAIEILCGRGVFV